MRAVDIRVGHDDDLVIAELRDVEILVADAGAERGNQRADLLRGQHLIETRALDVEDLAAERQHRLESAIASLLCRAAGGITLDEEQFGLRRIALLTVGELSGKRRDVERALTARELARLARSFAGGRGFDHFGDERLRLLRMALKPAL